ncbi:putative neural-cadherin 2 isoform X2 [Portunus trituberculatus]|uniref:putative neural-cadherin 2 isoform X2 n=1 Tax=Portunus trituberculatus TaxID=210409 RepID=UPI001E1CC3DF|nr:putative neural-cadherin 2 isoform X2 [Portunus trituberculatus]XP_045113361.1 putative neural-cadherin 2 isoform X2 [Portunus trituberculatus]
MDPARLLQIITNSTWMVTKLVGGGPVEFEQPQYMVEVAENTVADPLLRLTTRPLTHGERIEFSIKEGNEQGFFSVDSTSGLLSLVQHLDYEEQDQYELVVQATVGESSSEATVLVRVTDQNDHAPAFPRTLHETQITEEDDRHLPKTILTVKADDEDAGEYGHVSYRLEGEGVTHDESSSFAVNPSTGAILLLKPLDRDPPHGRSQWRLLVTASDGELEDATAVHVNLKDVNDNAPYFLEATINATITENTPRGASVAQVSALDNDDHWEGHNARLVYSLEKNVIDENSGRPIFAVNSERGLIKTALCCLDREKTPRYVIQVVATDGGGLKGTGTVLVEVQDVNDVSPKFSQPEWDLEVPESPSPSSVLATLTVLDPDITNTFAFRVVEGSGRGSTMFSVRSRPNGEAAGDLRALVPLDYEDPEHRQGFRFQVQVTDMGDAGWGQEEHVDETWVNLRLVDANDNAPTFASNHAHLTLPEDTPAGTLLASFTAHDEDGGGEGRIEYSIDPVSDPGRLFLVDETGSVRLAGELDRETASAHTLLILAMDDGTPRRTATATLMLNVTDINDNPPYLKDPWEVQVQENSAPQVVAVARLGDPDDWRQGHGPPFSIHLDPLAPPHTQTTLKVDLNKHGDEGRGVGVVSTRVPLDREQRRVLLVPLVVTDAGSPPLSATVTLTLHVADLNDNPMLPATKTVAAFTIQPQSPEVPLGRVYVKDPDDWDAAAKSYAWRDPSRHLSSFALNTSTGELTMRHGTPDGRYNLGFTVSDAYQSQSGVEANVSVEVKSLSHAEVMSSVPLTLATHPYRVVRTRAEEGSSILQQVMRAVRAWVRGAVRIVAVQGVGHHSSRVWLSSPADQNLHHTLLLYRDEISKASGVGITHVGVGTCQEQSHRNCDGGCWVRMSLDDGFTLIDANTSAVVGPQLGVHVGCGCASDTHPPTCTPNTCLNGGRCLPTPTGARCVCPHHTTGARCKVLSRHFKKDPDESGGWAWVPSLPSCEEVHISMEVLTQSKDATLLYSGPDHLPPVPGATSDVMMLELRNGRPSLVLDLGAGPVALTVNTSYSLADYVWHRLDLIWKDEQVQVIVDLCGGGSLEDQPATPRKSSVHDANFTTSTFSPSPNDANICRGSAKLPRGARLLNVGQPLQIGGLAHPVPAHALYGWPEPLLALPLHGCVRNLRINGQIMDLGHGILSQGSAPGCPAAECSESGLKCGLHSRCRGSPGNLRCECQPGWSGQDCNTATSPATFQVNSYVKLALSFTPLTYSTSLQLRFRTRRRRGELVVLSSQHGRDRLALQLVRGRLCLILHLHPEDPRSLCLTRAALTDGRWHSVEAYRHGSVTVLLVDDGDGDLYNASLSMDGRQVLEVDKQEGVHVGGSPEYVGVSVFKIHGDYHEGCVDDIRISGRRMPLPPAVNNTPWGQASLYQRVEQDCDSPPACANVTCRPPLTCVDTWRSHYCGCGEGRKLSSGRGTCEDVNECLWEPCLNGGSCFNKQAVGYICECPSGFGGDQCHIPDVTHTTLRLSLGALAAVLVWCAFLLLVVGAVLLHQHHSRSTFRRGEAQMKESAVNGKGTSSPPRRRAPSLLELQLLKPPRANGQPAWNNAHRTGEKALQADNTSAERTDDPEQGGDDAECSRNCRNRQLTFSCSVEDDLRNYAYEGDESSPGSLSSCKWTRRARNGRKVNYEVYRIRSSMEGCGNTVRVASGPHLVESWHPGTQHPRTTASITTLSSDSRHPVSTTTCDIHAADETTSLPMYPDLLSPPTGDVVSVTIPPELLTPPGPAQIPDPPRAFSTQ